MRLEAGRPRAASGSASAGLPGRRIASRAPRVWVKALRDVRWQILLYGAGMALLAALIVAIYPSYAGQLEDLELPEALRNLFGVEDYSTPEGFLSTEFFSQTLPVLLTIFAIMQGTAALAGEEANGTLDILLAQPIGRRRLALEKTAAFLISTLLISLLICPAWAISIPAVDVEVSVWETMGATFACLPLVWAIYATALLAAAALPNRRLATGVIVAFVVASYVVNALALTVDLLSPLRWLSPFNYYNGSTVLSDGPELAGTAALLAAFLAALWLALRWFERRDIGVDTGLRLPRATRFWPRGESGSRAV
jgi:ABC-2 type transport system permease protein